ncbi:MAG: hypothetical protein R3B57_01375 [Phycisphaerales bacterium]
MGRIVIAAFRPKAGMESELLGVIADRLPLLRGLGLATQRANITMRASDGTIVDVSEWVDEEAIERAHRTPEVLALWERFSACSDYVSLNTLGEVNEMFATFEAVE